MSARLLALLILSPFVLFFAYAALHELSRMKRDGRGSYGLAYDSETDTTHLKRLNEGESGYDPEQGGGDDPAEEDGDDETETPADQDRQT